MSLLSLLIISVLFFIVTLKGRAYKPLFFVLWAALLIRLGMATLLYYLFPEYGFTDDALWFDGQAWLLAQKGIGGILAGFGTGAALYTWVVSILYYLGGHDPFIPITLNVLIGVLTVHYTWKLSAQLTDDQRIWKAAAWICCLNPFFAFFSSVLYREPIVVIFLLIGLRYAISWSNGYKFKNYILGLGGFTMAGMFHTGATLALAGFAALSLLFVADELKQKRPSKALRPIIAIAALAAVFAILMALQIGLEKIDPARGVADAQSMAARGRGAYLQGFVPHTPFDYAWQIPVRIVYFLFTPFLWQIGSSLDILAFFESRLILTLTFGMLRNLKWIWSHKASRTVLVLLLTLLTIFSLGSSNFGTALRHREKFLPMLAMLGVGGLFRARQPEWVEEAAWEGQMEPQAIVG